jgi:hypothetical protein
MASAWGAHRVKAANDAAYKLALRVDAAQEVGGGGIIVRLTDHPVVKSYTPIYINEPPMAGSETRWERAQGGGLRAGMAGLAARPQLPAPAPQQQQ